MKINTKDNFELDISYNRIVHSKKVIVFTHGITVNKNDETIFVKAEKELQKFGYSTIRFDFRGHGLSQRKSIDDVTISNELIDLETLINFAQKEGYTWIGLAGASFGGGIAALFSGKHPNLIQKLFLANPVLDYEKGFLTSTTPWAKKNFDNVFERIDNDGFITIGSRNFKVGRKLFEEMSIYNPCEKLCSYKNTLLIVHGDKDSKVAFKDTLDCYQKLPNKKKHFIKIEGSDHGFHNEPYETQVSNLIIKFFTKRR